MKDYGLFVTDDERIWIFMTGEKLYALWVKCFAQKVKIIIKDVKSICPDKVLVVWIKQEILMTCKVVMV